MNNPMDDNQQNTSYERLLGVLKGFLLEARTFNQNAVVRAHNFRCVECGASEKTNAQSRRYVVDGAGQELSADSFLVISVEREAYLRDSLARMKTSYEYICPDCGVWLKEAYDEPFGR